MMIVIQSLGEFLVYVLIAMFVQNSVFARGFGASRLVKLVGDSTTDGMIFCALLCLIQVLSAPLGFVSNLWLEQPEIWYRDYLRPLLFVVATAIAFAVVMLLVLLFAPPNKKELLKVLPMASFNCTVLGPMLINSTHHFSFAQSVGFSLGSGLGYAFAVLIVTEGQNKMQNRKVPRAFRGLPINLLYIGILALAIYGLTGHRLAV